MVVDSEQNIDYINDEAFLSTRTTEERSSDAIYNLGCLLRGVGKSIATVEDRVSWNFLLVRLNRLPDEVLSLILGYVSNIFEEALRLSHVCSRFRSVLLSSPHAWNFVLETSMNSQHITAILARSGNLPLKVEVVSGYERGFGLLSETEQNNFEKILAQSGRVAELDFPDMSVDCSQQILNLYPTVHLPALRKLSVTYDMQTINKSFSHFYASWVLPNVEQLCTTGFVPQPNLATNITYCSLRHQSAFDIFALAEFIGMASSLRDLTLELGAITDTATGSPKVLLPLVTNTSIVSLNLSELQQCSPLPWMIGCIRLPNVIDMSLTIYKKPTVPFLFNVPKLKNLSIKVEYSLRILPFRSILRYAPQCLTSLSLRSNMSRVSWEEDRERTMLPRLRTLRFFRCNCMNKDNLKAVRAEFLKDGVEIERVEVVKCGGRIGRGGQRDLRDAFPKSDVCWKS
ncbi:hypothetical protein EW145_g1549 [Phellinidium pouzarii]|uniref:F-box domain-containing protein n=1 Tax=Phellinidium pouzarii TaxID=167371 RepID=A0A4S4LE52_9AGAM|nr:hypothetical protein EW145_g1549 [Phellinidium pouzarii]